MPGSLADELARVILWTTARVTRMSGGKQPGRHRFELGLLRSICDGALVWAKANQNRCSARDQVELASADVDDDRIHVGNAAVQDYRSTTKRRTAISSLQTDVECPRWWLPVCFRAAEPPGTAAGPPIAIHDRQKRDVHALEFR